MGPLKVLTNLYSIILDLEKEKLLCVGDRDGIDH